MSILPRLVPLLRGYTALDESQLATSTAPLEIAQGLAQGEWKLIEIVKGLQDSLTSENDQVRSRGVGLLSAVVEHMDKSTLDRQSTKVLTTFFTTKLADKPSLVACATALAGLTTSPSFGTLEGVEVVQGIFSSVTLKAHSQSIRHKIYLLLDHLMSNSRPALQRFNKNQEFLKGYCQLVEGEKDPRNLMISFGLIKVMLLEFDISGVVEDLFDITFCYFPITFTPPPDDPYGITSQDLILALRECLAATKEFGPLALPLFLDKLQASSEKAKRQTLEALTACFPIYGASTCGENAGRFSEALSIEVFHATDTEMQDLALGAFHSLFGTLYPDSSKVEEGEDAVMQDNEEKEDEGVRGIAVQVVKNSLDELEEPEKRDAKPAMRILIALSAGSNRLARYVLDQTLPSLLKLCQNPDEISLRPSALSHISILLSSLSPPAPLPTSSEEPTSDGLPPTLSPSTLDFSSPSSPLNPHRDTLLSLFTSSTRSTSSGQPSPSVLPALKGLIALIKLPKFLTQQELEFCVSSFNEIVISGGEGSDEVYDLALENLIIVSRLHPRTIESISSPRLFKLLPDSTPTDDEYQRVLTALGVLSIDPRLFSILSKEILSRLDKIVQSSASNSDATRPTLYAHHLLTTLRSVLQTKIDQKAKEYSEDVPSYLENGFVTRLVGMFVLPTTKPRGGEEKEVGLDLRLLVDVGGILKLVLQRVSAEQQTSFFAKVDEAFLGQDQGGLERLLGSEVTGSIGSEPFSPFSSSSSTAQQNLLSLYTSILLPLRPQVPLSPTQLSDLLSLLLDRSMAAQNELQFQSCLHGLSSLVNKRTGAGTIVEGFLKGELKGFWERNVEGGKGVDGVVRRRAMRVWTWIAKGLIARSDPTGYEMVESLLSLFNDQDLGRDAAKMLGVVAEDGDKVLSKENFSVIRLLYKQRFFTFLLPKLVAAHKEQPQAQQSGSTSSDQAVYLIALSSLLQHLSKQLTLTELPKLLPLLITSLELPDPTLRSNVIDTLGILVREVPDSLEPSISSIAIKTIKSAVPSSTSSSPSSIDPRSPGSIKLRLSSLNFLSLLPAHIPYLTLHPQKTTILKELGKAIDDPRRDVRRAAVDCRSKWFSYT